MRAARRSSPIVPIAPANLYADAHDIAAPLTLPPPRAAQDPEAPTPGTLVAVVGRAWSAEGPAGDALMQRLRCEVPYRPCPYWCSPYRP